MALRIEIVCTIMEGGEVECEIIEELARAGEFGSADATKLGKKAAVNHFNGFLEFEAHGRECTSFAHLSAAAACDLGRLQRFATYLMNVARDDRGDLLRPGTCLQYFSGSILDVAKMMIYSLKF